MKTFYSLCVLLILLIVSQENTATAQADKNDISTIFNYVKISDSIASAGQIPYDQMSAVKEAGFDVVINLATVSESGNALEGFLVAEQGMTYINIPVPFGNPGLRDLDMFFDIMRTNKDRKVFVHCAANMRASVFVYLYRTLVEGVDEATAKADMDKVWDPTGSAAWDGLIKAAKAR